MMWLLRGYDLTTPIRLDEPSISYSTLISVTPLHWKSGQSVAGKPFDWLATDGRTPCDSKSSGVGCAARGLTHTVSPTGLMSALRQKRTFCAAAETGALFDQVLREAR
jgi:hypothetical protein